MQFSLEQTTVEINGHTVTGWSDDGDALSLPDIELTNVKRGADGIMTASTTGEKGGPVILKLLPNSPSTKFFSSLVTTILNGGRVQLDGTIFDPINNITVNLSRGVLMTAPLGQTQGKGETANREFTIEFERVIPNYDAANF